MVSLCSSMLALESDFWSAVQTSTQVHLVECDRELLRYGR